MNARIRIRRADGADIMKLVELLRLLFAIEADFGFQEDLQRQGLTMLLNRAETLCLVAEVDRQVVGMCTAQVLVSTAVGGKKALIEDVVVREEFRGQGVGRMLLESIEKWAVSQGIRRMDLLADRNNDPALAFYQKLGWKKTELMGLQKKMD